MRYVWIGWARGTRMRRVGGGNPYLVNPRWAVAERVGTAVRRRWAADVWSVGVHGSLAHGDDTETSGVEMTVVTYKAGGGPRAVSRRVDGVLVRVRAVGADDYLREAQVLSPLWPLAADRFVTTRAVHDPDGWLRRLRDAHLGRLARARPPEFNGLAREAWVAASAAHTRAVRLAEWYETDAALLLLGEVRLQAAMVTGLLSRTYFRNSADAVRKTGFAGLDMSDLGRVLSELATEFAGRGRPVDATPETMFDG
ncbi:nucleotidyltransferase domain-containing protein [Catenuloplanes sp. NPDC051500]|uniref:nucleotidyltransferase domain-containing protein n=1 Tax=Catenuloplanes sp. NPDC051500 TaxID=3363959 RepID=UPI0037AEBD8F